MPLSFIFVVPRLLFDGWTSNDYHVLFSSEDATEDCVKAIIKFIRVSEI